MSARFRAPRGTADILPADQPYWSAIAAAVERVCRLFGYSRIDTPVIEQASLFGRGVGADTEIIEKQMYQFQDRGGDLMVLRPEGTAGICRAYLQAGMQNLSQPVRLWYIGPYFRYDRPQSGRMRQFSQFGFEAIGGSDAALDAEVIELSWRVYEEISLRGLTLELNSIGDGRCRPAYMKDLRDYYGPYLSSICHDCQIRHERNSLRILDCKRDTCRQTIGNAPPITDLLCRDCAEHFQRVREYLEAVGIPYVLNPRLVRGLDYYTRTVFEVVPSEEGAQSTIGAGGRYDGLIGKLGGRATPGVGFASGMERAIIESKRQSAPVGNTPVPEAFVAFLTKECGLAAYRLASNLRRVGHSVVVASGGRSLKAQMRQADASGADCVAIIGERELALGQVVLRRLGDGKQQSVPTSEVASHLDPAVWS